MIGITFSTLGKLWLTQLHESSGYGSLVGLSPAEAARRVYTHGADQSFWMATAFLAATWLLVTFVMRTPKATNAPPAGEGEAVSAGGTLVAAE